MKSQTIKAIFTNLLFVIGVILLIFGFINGALVVTRSFVFDKYPLQSYEETRCDITSSMPYDVATDKTMPTVNQDEIDKQQQKCLVSIERERQVKQTEDVVFSITTLVAGAVLVYSFKRFIFK